MSRAVRTALEDAQARRRDLERQAEPEDAGATLAQALRHEADELAALLTRVEARSLAREKPSQGARLMAFGFAVLFVLPMVAMVGFSLGAALRREPLAGVALGLLGGALLALAFNGRARQRARRALSPDWRLVRAARCAAARVGEG